MKKKTVSGATALAVLASATVPVVATPAVNAEELEVKPTSDVETENGFEIPEDEWKKVTNMDELVEAWNYDLVDGVILLKSYKLGSTEPKVEIPREIDGKPVELEKLKGVFSGVTHVRVAEGNEDNKVKLRATELNGYGNDFYDNKIIEYIDLSGLDVEVTSFYNAFQDAANLKYVNLSGWDVSRTDNFSVAFFDCRQLEYLNLSGWKLPENANTRNIYGNVRSIKHAVFGDMTLQEYNRIKLGGGVYGTLVSDGILDLTNLDLNGVNTLENMFSGFTGKKIVLSGWKNTGNVTTMKNMFKNASNLIAIEGLEDLDVSSVTDMSFLFHNATRLTNVDGIKNWNTSSLTNTQEVFNTASSLTSIDLTNWNMENVTELSWMFQNCTSLVDLKGTEDWTLSNVTRMRDVFKGTKLNVIDLSSANLPNVSQLSDYNMSEMFKVSGGTEEERKLLVITNDDRLKNYNFSGNNRTSMVLTLDANGGQFENGNSVKTNGRFVVSTSEYADIEQAINNDIANIEEPTKEGHDFVEWVVVGTPTTLLEKLNATYQATWKELEMPEDENMDNSIEVDSVDIEELVIEMSNEDVRLGNTIEFIPKLKLTNGNTIRVSMDDKITLTSNNENVEISEYTTSGQTTNHYIFHVDGKSIGETELTLNYRGLTKTINVNVFDYELVDGNTIELDLNGNTNTEIKVNKVLPTGKIDAKNITTFEVVDQEVATINDNVVTALKEGTTQIKVTTEGEEWTTITLNVVDTTVDEGTPEQTPSVPPVDGDGNEDEDEDTEEPPTEDDPSDTPEDGEGSDDETEEDGGDGFEKVNSISELNGVWEYNYTEGDEVVVLTKYLKGAENPKVEIPRVLDGKRVELESINAPVQGGVTHVRVADGDENNKVVLRNGNFDGPATALHKNENVKYLDLSGLEVNATNLRETFRGMSKLEYLNLSGWNVSQAENLHAMVSTCPSLKYVNLSGWDVPLDKDTVNFFGLTDNLEYVIFNDVTLEVYNKIKPSNVVANGVLELRNLDLGQVTSLNGMFRNSRASVINGLETWDTSNITNMENMFDGMTNLTSLNVSNWNTSNVIELSGMFQNCTSLTEIKGTEKWTFSKVTSMRDVFRNTPNLKVIDLSNSAIPSGTDMSLMFQMDANVGVSDEDKKLLIVTDDERIESYDFADSNRIPAAVRLEGNGGIFASTPAGDITRKVKERFYISPEEYNNIDQTIQHDFEALGQPLKDGYGFIKWEMKETPNSKFDMLDMTYQAVWKAHEAAPETPETPPTEGEGDNEGEGETPELDVRPQPPANNEKPEKPETGDKPSDENKPETEKPTPPTEDTKPELSNGIENLKDLDKELQEKVDSIIVDSVIQEHGLSLSIIGDSEDIQHVNKIEVTKDGIFAIVDDQKLKFDVSLEGLNLDLENARAIRVDKSRNSIVRHSAVPHKNTNGGLKITSNNLENILITSKVSEPFEDVDDMDWFKQDVEEAYNYGFTTGTSATTYSPSADITRGQFAVMIARALELTSSSSKNGLSDIEGKWYQNEAQALYEAGIIKGFNDGTFGGEKKLTRQQATIMIVNMLKHTGVNAEVTGDVQFADMDKISEQAQDAVKYLASQDILVNGEGVNFNPNNNLTRAQMAKMLVRSLRLTDLY